MGGWGKHSIFVLVWPLSGIRLRAFPRRAPWLKDERRPERRHLPRENEVTTSEMKTWRGVVRGRTPKARASEP